MKIHFQLARRSLTGFFRSFPVTVVLMITWSILYLYVLLNFGLHYSEDLNEVAGIVPGRISGGEYWRLFTYGYFHNGWLHFLTNMVFAFFFCPPLEQWLGTKVFLLFHGITVVTAGLAIYLLSRSTGVGASGFEYAILGFYLYMSLFHRNLIDGKLRTTTLILVAVGILSSVQVKLISFSGHFSGLIIGFVFALVYTRFYTGTKHRDT